MLAVETKHGRVLHQIAAGRGIFRVSKCGGGIMGAFFPFKIFKMLGVNVLKLLLLAFLDNIKHLLS